MTSTKLSNNALVACWKTGRIFQGIHTTNSVKNGMLSCTLIFKSIISTVINLIGDILYEELWVYRHAMAMARRAERSTHLL